MEKKPNRWEIWNISGFIVRGVESKKMITTLWGFKGGT